ncbi:MAG: hypothetical protein GY796_14950 [Chloroflexi bacterium]|nr:hypothetical protein [Chloroflexota bacterium]
MSNPQPHALSRRAVILILLLIIAIAAVFRFWQLKQMPPGLYHDEAYNGLDALSLVQGKTFPQFYEGWELYQNNAHNGRSPHETRWPIFFEGNYGREPLHIYFMAISIKLLGPTPFAIRAVPAFFGVLAVFTTFLAAKALLGIGDWRLEIGRKNLQSPISNLPNTKYQLPFTLITPLTAAFTLGILFPAVHFSRFGLRAMLFVPVETLAVYCFWQGINADKVTALTLSPATFGRRHLVTRSTIWFFLAGFLLGLGIYIYAAARLFPLLFVGFVLFWFWWDREALRRHWLDMGLMAGTSFLVALPILIFFGQYPYFFVFRIAYVSNKGKGAVAGRPILTWINNIWRVIGGLFWQGETHLRHNLPGRPYLDPIQIIFFLTGVLSAVKRLLNPRIFFLFLWLIIMLLPTILSGDAPHFGRMTGTAPAIAIFIGLGFEWVGHRITDNGQRSTVNGQWSTIIVYGLLITVLLTSAIWTAVDYFGRYASHPQLAADFYLPEWEMGQYVAGFGEDTAVYLTPTQEELATLYFALAHPGRLQNYAGEQGAVPAGVPGKEAVYLLRPSSVIALQNLQTTFPEGKLGQIQETYTPFILPAHSSRNLAQESDHSFAGQIQLAGWSLNEENGALAVTLVWQASADIEQDYTAFVHLIGLDGIPAAQVDRQPGGHPTSNWQPGEMIIDQYTVPLPDDLSVGNYTLTTGFYFLPTLEPLGETAVLGDWRFVLSKPKN